MKALLLSLIFGVGIIGAASAQTSGCGIGVNRGPYDGCNAVYGGLYRGYDHGYHDGYHHGYRHGYHDGYYAGSGRSLIVEQGQCGGRGLYRVCDFNGLCWARCN